MVKESVKAEAGHNCKSGASSNRTYEDVEADLYSSSGSSWVPSDNEDGSDDTDTGLPVKPKMRKPTYKTRTATRKYGTRKRRRSTVKEELQNDEKLLGKVKEIKDTFTAIFNLIDNIKRQCPKYQNSKEPVDIQIKPVQCAKKQKSKARAELSETAKQQSVYEDEEDNVSDELNRSTDNCNIAERNERVEEEWVPIGSGKTLVHRDKFKRVNWNSFTLATRTLLRALFPKIMLATHSLSGKGSPAFKDKPVKMCLDPQIISDVIMEIVQRFNVEKSQVRNVISLKCSDECKMLKKCEIKKLKNDENMPPDSDNDSDKENESEEED